MKKKGSLENSAIAELCFAAYPISFQLQNQPNCKLSFQFEKSQQVIFKIQAPGRFTQQKGILTFPCPKYIQHFRTVSDKKLDYQWSLYIQSLGDDLSQQFIETQKINLDRIWKDYQIKKQPVYENTVCFNKIKGTLKYLITMGNSNQAVLDNVKAYFRSIPNYSLNEEVQVQLPASVEKKREEFVGQIYSPSPQGKGESDQIKEQFSKINTIQSKISEVFGSPSRVQETQQKQENKEQAQVNRLSQGHEELPLPQNQQSNQPALHLTLSERELGNTIEVDIIKSEVKEPESVLQKKEKSGDLPSQPGLKMVQSQTISKPFYKNTKCAVVILIILILLAGGVLVTRKFDIYSSFLKVKTQQKTQKIGKKNKDRVKK